MTQLLLVQLVAPVKVFKFLLYFLLDLEELDFNQETRMSNNYFSK